MNNKKRQIYENQSTLKAEEEFVITIAERAGMAYTKMPRQYRVDFALTDAGSGEIKAWLEVKCRTGKSYPTFMLSLSKWMAGLELARETGQPFVVAFRWQDGDYILQIRDDFIPLLSVGGRADRNDPEDQEPIVKIPRSNFHFIQNQSK